MSIENYKIAQNDLAESIKFDNLAKKIKRDFLILFPLAFILILLADTYKNPTIEFVSYISIPLIFLVFVIRLVVFRKNNSQLKCPKCQQMLEKNKKGDESYIVCHRCRIIYKAYKPSSDPDKILEEINLNNNL